MSRSLEVPEGNGPGGVPVPPIASPAASPAASLGGAVSGRAPSFAVAALVREAPEALARFARHYALAGAASVTLYGDGPEDRAEAVAGVPGARFVPCGPGFWDALGQAQPESVAARPESVEARQVAVYEHAFAGLEADWLLPCDADELVFGEGSGAIRTFLGAVPLDVASVQVPSAEAVYGPGDALGAPWAARWFRLPTEDRALLVEAYGEDAALFQRGLLGHHEGKSFHRRGAALSWIGLHLAGRPGGGVASVPARDAAPEAWSEAWSGAWPGAALRLGHYDALSLERWEAKWRARLSGAVRAALMGPERRAQMAVIGEALAAGRGAALFARLYALDERQAALLSARGLAVRRDLFGPPDAPS